MKTKYRYLVFPTKEAYDSQLVSRSGSGLDYADVLYAVRGATVQSLDMKTPFKVVIEAYEIED